MVSTLTTPFWQRKHKVDGLLIIKASPWSLYSSPAKFLHLLYIWQLQKVKTPSVSPNCWCIMNKEGEGQGNGCRVWSCHQNFVFWSRLLSIPCKSNLSHFVHLSDLSPSLWMFLMMQTILYLPFFAFTHIDFCIWYRDSPTTSFSRRLSLLVCPTTMSYPS
jgi:hypothetical protein